ncbi:MAG: 50S ribosomal protein L29 [Bacteroidetes bacterium]|jgi:large subunit ribosomal protein L29|nr:50S ribosomal protein L29 [Bacteroidota bacterium]MBX7239616.1 50S ribosomal protein L29 [Bacteroidia bacterium]MCW5918975.1 50S ribosomal protein L29 [Bacteroidota bacterium]HMU77599.1 50S ribosomal protein L29 [Bacteroidia bacterium]HMW08903.1 50S ribosomal protein L29 [Bacteroidia bacterium]
MKQSIVRDLTTEEVKARIKEEADNLQKHKMQHAVSPMDNPMKIRSTRKLIARLKTELNKRMSQTSK